MKHVFIILFCFTGFVYGQNVIKGYVFDKKSHSPINYASVYVNGSNKCTRTNAKGFFILKDVKIPSLIVISHLNYELKTLSMENSNTDSLSIALTEKIQELGEVTVEGKSRRAECVQEFRKAFLGTDYWGENARMLNDSVLLFSRKNDTVCVTSHTTEFKEFTSNPDVEMIGQLEETVAKEIETFGAKSNAPLLVDLPLLGYTLSVDLVNFSISKTSDGNYYRSMRGYFHFIPYTTKSKSKQAKFGQNRKLAYYNSWLHFNRSLYQNSLRSNGYIMVGENGRDAKNRQQYTVTNPDSLILYTAPNEACVYGQKNRKYFIYYFPTDYGKPLSLFDKNSTNYTDVEKFLHLYEPEANIKNTSVVYFFDDECKIRNNGTIPENNKMAFRGAFGQKMVGAMLPDDYEPEKE